MTRHRAEKMASAVRAVVSDAIHNKLNDPRISPLSSVTRVEMSGDLQIARVFISVLGSDADERRSMAGLQHARGRIRQLVARKLRTRHCPEIRLAIDDVLKRAQDTIEIIERITEQHNEEFTAEHPENTEECSREGESSADRPEGEDTQSEIRNHRDARTSDGDADTADRRQDDTVP